tara:strand:+ start:997 stop:1416 length:420 start_codon:yes stop_codon:yes gene_type:complete
MDSAPWYQAGLRFECSQCGDCCTGAPGFVWVNKEEIAELARQTGEENISVFEEKYVRQVGIRKSLKEFSNGDCVFFDGEERTCKVYGARPRQCRTWPFWDSNLKSPADWERTCQICPGSGRGRLHQIEEIEARRTVLKI